ncbi:hypothetical protein LT013_16920 [Vibrio cholerae]|nr:hypothetical protein [Vibrio cholerae]MCO7021256.1 hypothetical protein [Vibrio paracholerae]
MKQQCIWRCKF